MLGPELIKDGERQMAICNACRYCEGYCAVFPAMELRRSFTKSDLIYLANLCFDCRDCYYACQYAPPHEFAVNIPKLMSELRVETYREFSWPAILSGLFKRNGQAVTVVTVGFTLIILFLVLMTKGPAVLLEKHLGEGSFYVVVPFAAMTLPAVLIALYAFVVLLGGTIRFWRETGAGVSQLVDTVSLWRATQDAFGLKYLKGGGVGCNYPGESFSTLRYWFHHCVFYGFVLDLASTIIAGCYHHFLGWQAPYPFWSWPVILGTMGGFGLLIGTIGLLYLKWNSDRGPAESHMMNMDVAFLLALFLTSLSGLLLLVLRETQSMGLLLVIHLGIVGALFLTLPYSKFAHVVYRYGALIRYAVEQRRLEAAVR